MSFVRPIVNHHVAYFSTHFASLTDRRRSVHERSHAQGGPFAQSKWSANSTTFHHLGVGADDNVAFLGVERPIAEDGARTKMNAFHGPIDEHPLGRPSGSLVLGKCAQAPGSLQAMEVIGNSFCNTFKKRTQIGEHVGLSEVRLLGGVPTVNRDNGVAMLPTRA